MPAAMAITATNVCEVMIYSDDDLAEMRWMDALYWCVDRNGHWRRDRLERVAWTRGYKIGWVYYVEKLSFHEACQATQHWRTEQAIKRWQARRRQSARDK